jgi:hypothetical protein
LHTRISYTLPNTIIGHILQMFSGFVKRAASGTAPPPRSGTFFAARASKIKMPGEFKLC